MGFISGGGFISAKTANYDWFEEITVLAKVNSFILTETVPDDAELLIAGDNCVFMKGINYTRTGQVIKLADGGLDETTTFQIWCFKKEG